MDLEPVSPRPTLQKAITLVSAALEDEDHLRRQTLMDIVTEPEGEPELIVGLTNLAFVLLTRIQDVTGVPPAETLQDIALTFHPEAPDA